MTKRREIALDLASVHEGLADVASILSGMFELMDQHAAKIEAVVEKAGVVVWGPDGVATHLVDQSIALVAMREDTLGRVKFQLDAVEAAQVKLLGPRSESKPRPLPAEQVTNSATDAEVWLRRRLSELVEPSYAETAPCALGGLTEQATALTQMLRGLCTFADHDNGGIPDGGWGAELVPSLNLARHIQYQRADDAAIRQLVECIARLIGYAEEHASRCLAASDEGQIILERHTHPCEDWPDRVLEAFDLAMLVEQGLRGGE